MSGVIYRKQYSTILLRKNRLLEKYKVNLSGAFLDLRTGYTCSTCAGVMDSLLSVSLITVMERYIHLMFICQFLHFIHKNTTSVSSTGL